MASDIPIQIAETIQTAHIKRDPSPRHDLNPSTAASKKIPVALDEVHDADDEEDIPYSVLRPRSRSTHLPPLPDLRFEQSYLHSIAAADTHWKVAWITIRDQVLPCSVPGMLKYADHPLDHDALCSRYSLQPCYMWMAILEQERSRTRKHGGC